MKIAFSNKGVGRLFGIATIMSTLAFPQLDGAILNTNEREAPTQFFMIVELSDFISRRIHSKLMVYKIVIQRITNVLVSVFIQTVTKILTAVVNV